MSKVLRADRSAADAYVDWAIGSPQPDVWVTFRLGISTAGLGHWTDPGSGGSIQLMQLADPWVETLQLVDAVFYGDSWFGNGGSEFGSAVAPVGGAWMPECELHYEDGVLSEFIIGGVTVWSASPSGSGNVDTLIRVGAYDPFTTTVPTPGDALYYDYVKFGTTRGGDDLGGDDFEDGTLDAWSAAVGDVSVVDDPFVPIVIAPPTRVFGQEHFFEGPPWRIVVSDLADDVLTFLDHLAMDRSITITRGAARVMGFRVPSDNPEVNIPAPDPTSDPFVAEGVRLVSFFRREGRDGSFGHRWVIRGRGIALDVDDSADSDHATTAVNAYDPWKYLYRRPVLLSDGSLPGPAGKVYPAGTRWSEIIIDQFSIAEATGGTIFTDYASTGFYTGTIENTDPLPDLGDGIAVKFDSGVTLGEMLDQAVASGTCDVIFDPIYDIANRPGILCELSIYQQAGALRENAIFGWDKFPRNVVELSRQILGTERANRVQMYAGQGGPPVPEESDAASIAKFGEYWALQYLPGVPSIAAAHTIAQRQLALLKNGQLTYALTPAAERAPLLFAEYREADTVPLHASKGFRAVIPGHHVRIESIPIVMGDDQLERVNQMLVSYAPETGS